MPMPAGCLAGCWRATPKPMCAPRPSRCWPRPAAPNCCRSWRNAPRVSPTTLFWTLPSRPLPNVSDRKRCAVAEPAPVTEEEFRRLSEFLYRRTGMVFTETKRYYVQRRVTDRMAATGSTSFASYFARLRSDTRGEVEQFINAFTVNETYFYREEHQLRCLTTDLLRERTRTKARGDAIRIWSVPCATGEEPYSLAMWLLENWA